MGDPISAITALGLAGNIAQFCKYAAKIVSKGNKIYRNAEGAFKENDNLETVSRRLQNVTTSLSQSLAHEKLNMSHSSEEHNLLDISTACEQTATELVAALEALKVKVGPGQRISRWRSLRQALKTVCKKEELDGLAATLEMYRRQLDTHILVSLRARFENLNLQNSDITNAVIDGRRAIEQSFQRQNELLEQSFRRLSGSRPSSPVQPPSSPGISPSGLLTTPSIVVQPPQDMSHVESSLLSAASSGATREIRRLCSTTGVNVDAIDQHGHTALMLAVQSGHIGSVRALCSMGASIRHQDVYGRTPLHLAIAHQRSAITRYLLSSGADPSILDDYGRNAWSYASKSETADPYIAWMMINGLEVDTALVEFASSGHLETVLLLLENDANKNTRGSDSETALIRASRQGHARIVQVLVETGADLDLFDSRGWIALMMAAANGHLDTVEYLIRGKPNLEVKDNEWGFTALILAVWHGHCQVSDYLLKAGCSPEPKGLHDFRPLSRACWAGKVPVVDWLLKNAKLKINDRHRYGYNALMEAAAHGKAESVKLLLAAGACTEIRSEVGDIAIMTAAWQQHTHIMEILLAANANINNAKADGFTALMIAADQGNVDMVRLSLEHGAYIDARTYKGYTPLQMASWRGRTECVRMLLNHGANPSSQNQDYWSPLTEAAFYGHDEIMDVLIRHGSDLSVVTDIVKKGPRNDGYSLLMMAVDKHHPRAVERLLQAGVDKNFKSYGGDTATSLAFESGQIDVLRLLEKY